jgi:hypothetical protein
MRRHKGNKLDIKRTRTEDYGLDISGSVGIVTMLRAIDQGTVFRRQRQGTFQSAQTDTGVDSLSHVVRSGGPFHETKAAREQSWPPNSIKI